MEVIFKCDKHYSKNSQELEEGDNRPDVNNYSGNITIYIKTCEECLEEEFNRGYDEAKQNIEDEKEIDSIIKENKEKE